MNHFHGRLALQQRVLPNYRAPFFDLLASACKGGMSLFTGLPRPSEGITTAKELQIANYQLGQNIHLLSGSLYLCYQRGLIDRGSERALSFDSSCDEVDAPTRQTGHWLGIRFTTPGSPAFSEKMGRK